MHSVLCIYCIICVRDPNLVGIVPIKQEETEDQIGMSK